MMSANVHDEEFLLQNVQDLRQRLQLTERSLRNLDSFDAEPSVAQYGREKTAQPPPGQVNSGRSSPVPDPLTIEDLTPESTARDESFTLRTRTELSEGSYPLHSSPMLTRPKDRSNNSGRSASGLKSRDISEYDHENESLRHKLQLVREENAGLVSQNHKLHSQVENAGYEVRQSSLKVQNMATDMADLQMKIPELRERITCVEAENKSLMDSLKEAEERYEGCQKQISGRDSEVDKFRDELQSLSDELDDIYRQRKRAENDRDFALQSAEEMQDCYEEFQKKTNEKFKKFQSHEEQLKQNLQELNSDKASLAEEMKSVKSHIENIQLEMRQVQAENLTQKSNLSALEQQNIELRTRLTSSSQKLGKFEADARTASALSTENKELRTIVEQQRTKLDQCRAEISNSRAQLQQLANLAQSLQLKAKEHRDRDSGVSSKGTQKNLSLNGEESLGLDGSYLQSYSSDENRSQISELKKKLSLAESELQHLRELLDRRKSEGDMPSTVMENLKRELKSVTEKSRMAERREEELEGLIKKLEEERRKHTSQLVSLEEKVADYEVSSSSLGSKLGQRNNQVTELQKELSDKASDITTMEREVRKKSAQISSLERQLDEKVFEVTEQVSKVNDLEEEVQVKTFHLQRANMELDEKTNELLQYSAMTDKMKQLQQEQCHELERQLDMMERRYQSAENKLTDAEKNFASSQQLLDAKDGLLTEAKMELDRLVSQRDGSVRTLEKKCAEATEQVAHLQSALVVCQEELKLHIGQLEETRSKHHTDMASKLTELERLREELVETRRVAEMKESQVYEYEKGLSERQAVLEQSTTRVRDLEDSHAQLIRQVSQLEGELQREKSALGTELSNVHTKLHQACNDMEGKDRELRQLKQNISALQDEKEQLSDQVHYLEEQLQEEGRELAGQGEKTRELERAVRELRGQVRDREEHIQDLEDNISQYQDDLKEKSQRGKELNEEIQRAQSDLLVCDNKLSEAVQRLQSQEEEGRQCSEQTEVLRQTVRRNQDEIRSRNQEVEDLNLAITERQWELQQRAAQITQLDMTIKEYKSDMEQKMIRLEASLKKAQLEVQQRDNQVSSLDGDVQRLHSEVQERSLQLQKSEQTNRKHKADLDVANEHLQQLSQQLEALHRQLDQVHCGSEDMDTELRHCRDQMQRMHHELSEVKRELSIGQREQEKLGRELDDSSNRLKMKETEVGQLSMELGSQKAKEAKLEARHTSEIKRLKAEIENIQDEHDQEIREIQESHGRVLSSKEEFGAQHRVKMQEWGDKEAIFRAQLDKCHAQMASLEADLMACKGTIEAANQAVLLKDAEMARLQTRISSLQRAALTSQDSMSFGTPPISPPKPPGSTTNNPPLSSGPNMSSYLDRMSFVKYQRNPPQEKPSFVKERNKDSKILSATQDNSSYPMLSSELEQPAGTFIDQRHQQYLDVKLSNMKDLVQDTAILSMSHQTNIALPKPHAEQFMPLTSDSSAGSTLSGTVGAARHQPLYAPKPVLATLSQSYPLPAGARRGASSIPQTGTTHQGLKGNWTGSKGAAGTLGALDLTGVDSSDPDSLQSMLQEIKAMHISTDNSSIHSRSTITNKKNKSAKSRLLEQTASSKAKTAVPEEQQRKDRIQSLLKPRPMVGKVKGKVTKAKPSAVPPQGLYEPPYGSLPATTQPVAHKIDKVSIKSTPNFEFKEKSPNISTAISHYSGNQSNNNISLGYSPPRNGQSQLNFQHDLGQSPFKVYQSEAVSGQSAESADELLIGSSTEERICEELQEGHALSKSQSFPEGLNISAITDDSSKVPYDSVSTSQQAGPMMSTANNTQVGGVSEIEGAEHQSCLSQLQLRRLAIQQRQAELNSQLAAADAQLGNVHLPQQRDLSSVQNQKNSNTSN